MSEQSHMDLSIRRELPGGSGLEAAQAHGLLQRLLSKTDVVARAVQGSRST